MMKNTNLFLSVMIVFFMITACSTNPKPAVDASSLSADSLPAQQPDSNISDPADTATTKVSTFAIKASARNLMNMVLGQLAQENAQNERVKKFGVLLIKEHTKSGKKLMDITADKHIMVPAEIPARMQLRINELSKLKGAEFDRRYMIIAADNQQKDINLFEKAAKDLKDSAFNAFIVKTLPALKMQLDSAKSIKNEL